ncbi:MAG: glutamate--tRNA ligase [Candidatus Kapabacteria bacterium]|nr:glutamate--tRNA ligase [Candidatus Kapabacteria bacterium]MDW8012493.1 glutamate--tRNA ligase [Bacteroidota bacterium]
MSVRVRFAPSPTGFLHIGGLRTALYNFLFARHHGGSFILRIEDTDQERTVPGAVENIIEMLRWVGLEFDEGPHVGGPYGPYVQSQRLELYRRQVQVLIERGAAYYAFDTPEELERMRERQRRAGVAPKYDRFSMRNAFTLPPDEVQRLLADGAPVVIRLLVPLDEEIRFHDIIRGDIVVHSRDIDDQVLLKSDGFPTYHLANVVDDHFMRITHVIRGEEWIPSTPKHILLYRAFGWEPPQFAHLPLLLNPDRSKLSKRHGDVAVEDFRQQGYFPEALLNFVALLGWNPTADREIFTLEELIASFELSKVNRAPAIVDRKKLDWMNAQYLRMLPVERLALELQPILRSFNYPEFPLEYVVRVVALLRERVDRLPEIATFGDYMFVPPQQYDWAYFRKYWREELPGWLEELLALLEELEPFTMEQLQQQIRQFVEERGQPLRAIVHPLRLILTGKSVGAGIFETMEVLGKAECIHRIRSFLAERLPAVAEQMRTA